MKETEVSKMSAVRKGVGEHVGNGEVVYTVAAGGEPEQLLSRGGEFHPTNREVE